MNPTPTNLPPSVAHNFGDRDTVDGVIEQIGFEMNQGYLSPKNGALVKAAQDRVRELAARAADPAPVRELLLVRNGVHDRLQVTAEPSRDGSTLIVCVADPAPVADEAAIEKWNLGLVWDTNQLVYRLSHGDKETALRLMRAAPRNDDKLRKLREWLIAKNRMVFRESIEAWSFEDHVGPDGVVKEIDKLLAESPAGDADNSPAIIREAVASFEPWVQGPGVVSGILHLQETVRDLRSHLQTAEAERDAAIRDRQDAEALQSKLASDLAAAQKERDVAKAEAECHSKNHDTMLDEVERLRRDLAAAKADRDAFREELDTHIEARQNCKHILVGESAVQAVERLAKERDWERHEWPKQIAAALHTEVGTIGATPSMVATAVQLEHEAHTRCLDRLVKAKNELAAAKAEGAKAVVEELEDLKTRLGNVDNCVSWKSSEAMNAQHQERVRTYHQIDRRIAKLRAAQPQSATAAPAATSDPDSALRNYMQWSQEANDANELNVDELALRELCRRALEGKP